MTTFWLIVRFAIAVVFPLLSVQMPAGDREILNTPLDGKHFLPRGPSTPEQNNGRRQSGSRSRDHIAHPLSDDRTGGNNNHRRSRNVATLFDRAGVAVENIDKSRLVVSAACLESLFSAAFDELSDDSETNVVAKHAGEPSASRSHPSHCDKEKYDCTDNPSNLSADLQSSDSDPSVCEDIIRFPISSGDFVRFAGSLLSKAELSLLAEIETVYYFPVQLLHPASIQVNSAFSGDKSVLFEGDHINFRYKVEEIEAQRKVW